MLWILLVVCIITFYVIVALCIIGIVVTGINNNTGRFKKNTLKERDVRKEISDFLGRDETESKIILNNLNNAIGEPDQKEFEMTGREHFIWSYNIIRKIQEACPSERYLEYAYNREYMGNVDLNNGIESTAFVSIISVMIGVAGIAVDILPEWSKAIIVLMAFILCTFWWGKCISRSRKKDKNDMFYLNIIEQVLRNNSHN